jgi:hypothetical protein
MAALFFIRTWTDLWVTSLTRKAFSVSYQLSALRLPKRSFHDERAPREIPGGDTAAPFSQRLSRSLKRRL